MMTFSKIYLGTLLSHKILCVKTFFYSFDFSSILSLSAMNNTGGPTRTILAPSESRMMRRLSDQLESMSVMMPSSNQNNENPNAFDCSILVNGGERVWVS
jgi:hypothetical protein